MFIPDPGSWFLPIPDPEKTYSGSRIQGSKAPNPGSRIRIHNTVHNTIKWIYADPDPQTQNLSTHTVPYLIPESGSNKNGDAPELVLSLLQKYFENKCSKTETS
jgi:hypothetical protein